MLGIRILSTMEPPDKETTSNLLIPQAENGCSFDMSNDIKMSMTASTRHFFNVLCSTGAASSEQCYTCSFDTTREGRSFLDN